MSNKSILQMRTGPKDPIINNQEPLFIKENSVEM